MVARSTRNKIRFQGHSAVEDLRRAQEHLIGLTALADEQSDYIDKYLPAIITMLEALKLTLEQFTEGL